MIVRWAELDGVEGPAEVLRKGVEGLGKVLRYGDTQETEDKDYMYYADISFTVVLS